MAQVTRLSLFGGVARTYGFEAGTVPDPFFFDTVSGVALSAADVTSNIITLTGLGEPASFTLSGDASAEYSLNSGPWSTAPGSADEGDTFQLRLDAAATYNTGVTAILDVGGQIGTFVVITLREPAAAAAGGGLTRLHARRI